MSKLQQMPKPLHPSDFEKIIQPLPAKDRTALREEALTPEVLCEKIGRLRKLMRRDIWIGPIWVVLYGVSLFTTGYGNLTIVIFVIGAAYFIYTVFTTGSFGLNRRRVKVYAELLEKMEGRAG